MDFSLYGLTNHINKSKQPEPDNIYVKRLYQLRLFLYIGYLSLYISAITLLLRNWKNLQDWAKIIGIIGIIPYVPFGPVLTITVSLVGQN